MSGVVCTSFHYNIVRKGFSVSGLKQALIVSLFNPNFIVSKRPLCLSG